MSKAGKKSEQSNAAADDAGEGNDIARFESALLELETLVETLESGELSLDESLKQFERGIVLVRGCQANLRQAELKVKKLSRDADGNEALEDFTEEIGAAPGGQDDAIPFCAHEAGRIA